VQADDWEQIGPAASASPDIMIAMPVDILFDFAAVQVGG
jgi:hypothetical protein